MDDKISKELHEIIKPPYTVNNEGEEVSLEDPTGGAYVEYRVLKDFLSVMDDEVGSFIKYSSFRQQILSGNTAETLLLIKLIRAMEKLIGIVSKPKGSSDNNKNTYNQARKV